MRQSKIEEEGIKSPANLIGTKYESLIEKYEKRAQEFFNKKKVSHNDILKYLEDFRGEGGSKMISALHEKIPENADKIYKEYLKDQKLYKINYDKALNDGVILSSKIVEEKEDQERWVDPSDLMKQIKQYDLNWNKKEGPFLFSNKPHVMLTLKNGVLPPKYIKKIK